MPILQDSSVDTQAFYEARSIVRLFLEQNSRMALPVKRENQVSGVEERFLDFRPALLQEGSSVSFDQFRQAVETMKAFAKPSEKKRMYIDRTKILIKPCSTTLFLTDMEPSHRAEGSELRGR